MPGPPAADTVKEICNPMGISRTTLYAYVDEFSDGKTNRGDHIRRTRNDAGPGPVKQRHCRGCGSVETTAPVPVPGPVLG